MRDYLFFIDRQSKIRGGGYQCPQCSNFSMQADGFGVSHCGACCAYFSVPHEPGATNQVSAEWLKQIFHGLKNGFRKIMRW